MQQGKKEESVGTDAITSVIDRAAETIFDCGDADESSNVDFVTRLGTFT